MSYTVLARRYRSSTFDEVIGQEAIAKTLLNAIAQSRVAHAYLFTGTRGVGKTTTARLFARALNAPDSIPGCPKPGFIAAGDSDKKSKKGKKDKGDAHEYPAQDVQDRMADAIMAGQDLNVIEIDGASNNGVEQARQLISNAGLAPTGNALYKVYIIDEVHMLSTAAFNALLKTMEEPPSHVKFILCTTEAHKVPATIQSRCQRFDFRNIPTAKISEHLKTVLKQEKVKAEDEVVWQLARLGNGSMRDALSLLDRLIATGESPLTDKVLEDMLGLPAPQLIIELMDAFAAGDVGASLTQTAALLNRGISEDQVIEVLIDRLRTLMLVVACGADSDLVELSDEAKTLAAAQAKKFDAAGLVHMIALCEHVSRSMRQSSNPRALLDATIARLALAEKMADVAALLAGRGSLPAGDSKKKVVGGEGREAGVRSQESGDRGQEAGDRRQGTGDRGQEAGERGHARF
ncbi:MAG: DNA polymerase III subunit gamma/tau, partial [Phycisphaeraceae bacterium]